MIERVVHGNGVVTYQAPMLSEVGVVHGFSTRVGGVSRGAFESLNLGNGAGGAGDEAGKVEENWRRLLEGIGAAGYLRAWVSQVHGRRVEMLEREPEGEYGETVEAEVRDRFSGQMEADGLGSSVPGVLATIRVADCVGVLLASEDGKVVAAVHAGWRGVVGGVVGRAVRAMGEAGAAPARLVAAIGPGIGVEHFEVGEAVAMEFLRVDLGEAVVRGLGSKAHVDLQKAVRMQLVRAGVAEGRIEGNDLCTFRDAGAFYSHRRDKGVTGRMAAVIGARE